MKRRVNTIIDGVYVKTISSIVTYATSWMILKILRIGSTFYITGYYLKMLVMFELGNLFVRLGA